MLQTADADSLREAGRAQRTSERVLQASRGVIFDRNGDELALSVPSTTIIANPKLVGDPAGDGVDAGRGAGPDAREAAELARRVHRAREELRLRRPTGDRRVRPRPIDALDLNGIDGIDEDRRTMPGGEVGKSVIGRTDIDGVGTAGIEKQYDDLLTGTDGEQIREHDRDGRSLAGHGRRHGDADRRATTSC